MRQWTRSPRGREAMTMVTRRHFCQATPCPHRLPPRRRTQTRVRMAVHTQREWPDRRRRGRREERHAAPRVYSQVGPLLQCPPCAGARTSARAAAYVQMSMLQHNMFTPSGVG
jgi:hypothetical protein